MWCGQKKKEKSLKTEENPAPCLPACRFCGKHEPHLGGDRAGGTGNHGTRLVSLLPHPHTSQQARAGPSCLLSQRKLLQGVVMGPWVSPAPSLVPHMLRSRKEQEQVRRKQHSPDITLTQEAWQQGPCPGLGEPSPISLRPSGHHGQHHHHHKPGFPSSRGKASRFPTSLCSYDSICERAF